MFYCIVFVESNLYNSSYGPTLNVADFCKNVSDSPKFICLLFSPHILCKGYQYE